MKRYIFIFVFAWLLQPHLASAEFNFYIEDCTQVAANGCAGPLVDGPKCLTAEQGECAEYQQTRKCDWEQTNPIGLPEWKCTEEQGACINYEQVCKQYEKICKAGYKKVCKKRLKPYAKIKNELAWAVYRPYMQRMETGAKKPLHASILKDFQPYYKFNLKAIRVSLGAVTTAITDCSSVYLPSASLMDALTTGKPITNDQDLSLVLHEFRHAEHCQVMGGRKAFASAWFGKIGYAMKPDINVVIKETLEKLAKRGTRYLHTLIPNEAETASFTQKHLPILKKATRHGAGKQPQGVKQQDTPRAGPRSRK